MHRLPAFLVLLATVPTTRAAAPERFEYEEPHMGTKFRVVLYAPDRAAADRAAKAVFARVEELNRVMSDYDPKSELMRLCERSAAKPAGPTKVSDDLFYVLAEGQKVAELSDGAFDMTIGPVVRLWRQARKDRLLPDEEVRAEALKKVGYKKLVLDPKAKTIDLTVAGMQLDLGGIAKGYAADEGLKVLAKHGVSVALVAASGDIAV
jgi:FAD:protein FMN transferase